VELNARLVLEQKLARTDQKLKTLRKYVQQYSSGWKKRVELAELLYGIGNWEQAVEEYRQVIERQPQLIDVRLKLAKLLHLMGREAEAIEAYEDALPLARNLATRHHICGWIVVCKGGKQEAIQAFESATSFEPDNAAHWLALGQVQMEVENTVAAWRAFDAILSLNPDDTVALIYSYNTLMALGDLREAGKRLNRARELAPDDYQVLKRLAEYRCRMRLVTDEAGKQTKQIVSAALKLAPDAADAQKLLSDYYVCRGEWAKGVEVLQQFTEQHPNNPSGWYYYGCCLFQTGENQGAAEAMLNAYRLYSKDCEIYRALCEILPVAGRLEELRPLVEEMLERFAEHWSVWATAGRVLVEQFQEIERGCDVSARGTQLQPQLPDAWFRHGRVLALAGKHREAVEALEQGWEWLEEGWISLSVPAAVWLFESYRLLGDEVASRKWRGEASERSHQLMEFDPVMAAYWQGRLLEGVGDLTGAIQAYRTTLS
jgi:tetratricopeptide (TPR) repeat protein